MSGRVAGLGDRELVVFTFDGQEINAWQGDHITSLHSNVLPLHIQTNHSRH